MPLLSSIDDRTFTHPYLDVLPREEWRWGYQEGSNLAMLYQGEKPFLLFLGEDESTIARMLDMSKEVAPSARIAIERRFESLLDLANLDPERSRWDWMGIFEEPQIAATDVVDLGKDHDEQIAEFLKEASPTASTQPGGDEVVTWHGLQDEHGLLAVGAAIRWKSGAAVLASIATAPRARGKGLATQVTASLTRMFFDAGEHRVTLGLFAENAPARRAYEKVGYQLLGEFTSVTR